MMVTKIYTNATIVPNRILDMIIENRQWAKRICIDLDGVVCEYDFPKIVRNFFGVNLDTTDIFAYDLADVLGVSPESIDRMFIEQVWGKPNFVAGAMEILRSWHNKGYELIINSNRIKYMGEAGLAKWLIEWQIPFDGFHSVSTSHGYSVSPNYDVCIDDSPAKLMSTNSRLKLLFSQPWNKKCLDIFNSLTRVGDWQEVRKVVEND